MCSVIEYGLPLPFTHHNSVSSVVIHTFDVISLAQQMTLTVYHLHSVELTTDSTMSYISCVCETVVLMNCSQGSQSLGFKKFQDPRIIFPVPCHEPAMSAAWFSG